MEFLKLLYKYWMKFAKALGKIQAAILLFFIYFLGVGVMAVIAFIFRKDFLDKRFTDKETFWGDRAPDATDLESCKRQF